jgi:hypothetical protein
MVFCKTIEKTFINSLKYVPSNETQGSTIHMV